MRRRRRRPPAAVSRSGPPRLRPLAELIRLPYRSPLHPELLRALAAADGFHLLRTDLEPVPVRTTATTSQAAAYRSRDADPIDIRVSRRHGRVALSFIHELGHLVDHQLGREVGAPWASGDHDAFADWREATRALASRLPPGAARSRRRYFESTKEVWARSYAQTVLSRSENARLQRHLVALLDEDDIFLWPAREFEPVAVAVESTLDRLGLLRAPRLFLAAA